MGENTDIECDLNSDDILYFLHIPKTAGTSLTNVLETPYNYSEIYQDVLWLDLFEKLPKNLNDFKGKMSKKNINDPFAYRRAQYVDILMHSEEIFKKYPTR